MDQLWQAAQHQTTVVLIRETKLLRLELRDEERGELWASPLLCAEIGFACGYGCITGH